MSDAYRRELVIGCPEADDDDVFYTALAQACASWTVSAVSWNINEAIAKENASGLVSLRQRIILHLDAFTETANWLGKLPALRDTADALATKLRALWGDEAETPLYAALR